MATIIDDSTSNDVLHPPGMATGLVPRDLSVDPWEMFATPDEMDIIPESEWDARIDEQEERQSSLEHIWRTADGGRLPPNLYQNGQGYCWSHSTTNAMMLSRAVNNQPYVPLSAYMVACIVKNYRDQGGWCGQSAKFIAENGVCSQEFWPQQDMSQRRDTPDMRANAQLHRQTEEWRDLARPIYGQYMTFEQVMTCLLNNQPCALDFNWWGHSVCGVRAVRVERGSYGIKILNSWGDQWGTDGFGILRGSKTVPDGAISIMTTTASGE